jgi:hypothetical protein
MLFSGDPLADVARRSLAVEPMAGPPNAFRTGEALIRLKPGASFAGTWGIAYANVAGLGGIWHGSEISRGHGKAIVAATAGFAASSRSFGRIS